MPASLFRPPIPWLQVARRTAAEVADDRCFGLAAQLAFYFLLALFPALLFGVALLGYIPIGDGLDALLTSLGAVAPQEILRILREQIAEVTKGNQAGLVSLGIAGAIWSSSAAMVAIIDALNHAFDVAEWRPWWKRRLTAILLTIALVFFVIAALSLVLVGPAWAFRIAHWAGFEPAAARAWTLLRWPVMVACIVLGVDLVYHFAPNRNARWRWLTPGSLLATALWMLSSFGFKLYVTGIADYAATYGALGGIIVTMLWFYLSSMAILIGAELNGVIEQTLDRADAHRPRC